MTPTQADREAAASLIRWVFPNTEGAGEGIIAGQWDHEAPVQAFAARARKAHQDAIEEAAKVAESFPFSDSAAIAHRIRALIDKEPGE